MKHSFVETTYTFVGEANYSWAKLLKIRANTMRCAVNKISCNIDWQSIWEYLEYLDNLSDIVMIIWNMM